MRRTGRIALAVAAVVVLTVHPGRAAADEGSDIELAFVSTSILLAVGNGVTLVFNAADLDSGRSPSAGLSVSSFVLGLPTLALGSVVLATLEPSRETAPVWTSVAFAVVSSAASLTVWSCALALGRRQPPAVGVGFVPGDRGGLLTFFRRF